MQGQWPTQSGETIKPCLPTHWKELRLDPEPYRNTKTSNTSMDTEGSTGTNRHFANDQQLHAHIPLRLVHRCNPDKEELSLWEFK